MKNNIHLQMQVSCSNCKLDEICMPRGLSASEVDDLSSIVQRKKVLHKGEFIYRQGDEFKGILAIQSGAAKLVTDDLSGNEHILNILLPGELLGFDGLNDQHGCSAIALNTVSFCELPGDKIDAICHQVPGLMKELFRHSNDKLKISQERVVNNKRPAETRVAVFLLDLSSRYKERGFSPSELNLPLTREEIGNHLGLAIETISRIFKHFQDKKLITVKQKQIQIIDLEGLRRIQANESDK